MVIFDLHATIDPTYKEFIEKQRDYLIKSLIKAAPDLSTVK